MGRVSPIETRNDHGEDFDTIDVYVGDPPDEEPQQDIWPPMVRVPPKP